MYSQYEKYNKDEQIDVGDLISIREDGTVTRSYQNSNKNPDKCIIGICSEVKDNIVTVMSKGYTNVNTIGITMIGSKITASDVPGKARILKYDEECEIYNIRSVGKIIALYNDIHLAKILIDIE